MTWSSAFGVFIAAAGLCSLLLLTVAVAAKMVRDCFPPERDNDEATLWVDARYVDDFDEAVVAYAITQKAVRHELGAEG